VLTRPDGLDDDALVRALREHWNVTAESIAYRPVGFGSHHWAVTDALGTRWFVTVDELGDGDDFARLHAAVATAADLRAAGHTWVVGPVASASGAPLVRIDDRFAAALFPHVDGESFTYGNFRTADHRRGVLDLVVALHSVPRARTPHVRIDDLSIVGRAELAASVDPNAIWEGGPYSRPAANMLADHADTIRRLLVRYDDLARELRDRPGGVVLTHGEPHAANTIRTTDGWVLIDWDTVLLAPPERDLWNLDPGDGSILRAYAGATGTTPRPSALELYRIRWDLTDIAVYLQRFRRPHARTADDEKSWNKLCSLITHLPN